MVSVAVMKPFYQLFSNSGDTTGHQFHGNQWTKEGLEAITGITDHRHLRLEPSPTGNAFFVKSKFGQYSADEADQMRVKLGEHLKSQGYKEGVPKFGADHVGAAGRGTHYYDGPKNTIAFHGTGFGNSDWNSSIQIIKKGGRFK